jgi:hypothetical protein
MMCPAGAEPGEARAHLDFPRALAAEAADRDGDEQLAREFPDEGGDHTPH